MRLARCVVAILIFALAGCAGSSKTTGTGSTATATATQLGTATVTWEAPTTTADGNPLGTLAGFKIYYGLDPAQMDEVVMINDPSLTSTEIENLTQGTWYFGATAIDSSGLESALSNVGSKNIT